MKVLESSDLIVVPIGIFVKKFTNLGELFGRRAAEHEVIC